MQRDHKVLKALAATMMIGTMSDAAIHYAKSDVALVADFPVPEATRAGFQPAGWGGFNPLAPATFLTMPEPGVFGFRSNPILDNTSS